MQRNLMRMRYSGSIYDGFSPRGQHALAALRGEFQDAGFYAEKERHTERSLRVYPERRWRYPLLNPSLVASKRASPIAVGGPSVLCPIYSDGDVQITRLLQMMPPLDGASYLPALPRPASRYFLHGYVVLPLRFVGEPRLQLIDFAPLRPPLSMLQLQLSRLGF
jgi:hypothetical protein